MADLRLQESSLSSVDHYPQAFEPEMALRRIRSSLPQRSDNLIAMSRLRPATVPRNSLDHYTRNMLLQQNHFPCQ